MGAACVEEVSKRWLRRGSGAVRIGRPRVFVQTGVLPLASIESILAHTWASIKYRFQALLRPFVPSPPSFFLSSSSVLH